MWGGSPYMYQMTLSHTTLGRDSEEVTIDHPVGISYFISGGLDDYTEDDLMLVRLIYLYVHS